jgi:hypothetical protein
VGAGLKERGLVNLTARQYALSTTGTMIPFIGILTKEEVRCRLLLSIAYALFDFSYVTCVCEKEAA